MKRLIGIGLAAGAMLVGSTTQAHAASFLSITVGATTVSCDNSTAASLAACSADFSTSLDSNVINFTGTIDGVSFGSTNTVGVQVVNTEDLTESFSTDTKTTVFNNTATSQTVTVRFAGDDFDTPLGSPLSLTASQTFQRTTSAATMSSNFTGYGDAGNTLVPGTGAVSTTPTCTITGGAGVGSCATQSANPTLFARAGAFALSGIESFTILAGETVNASGSVSVTGVPEPAALLLLGTGLFAAVRRMRRRIA